MIQKIPQPAKRRLVLLEHLLSTYKEKNITSQKIQEMAGWSSAVVRRDISYIDVKCGATNGYKVAELREALRKTFNLTTAEQKCCIVGLGRMGQALLDNSELYESPFKIVAGFDSSVNKTEVLSSAFPLHPTTLMKKIIKEEAISFAILTVDPEEAQPMTELLLECGIKGIVNYTPCVLTVPKGVSVENVSLLTALSTLAIQ